MTLHARRHTIPDDLRPDLARLLRGALRTERLWDCAGGTALALCAGTGLTAMACLFDRFMDVAGMWRLPLPWITLGVVLACLVRMAVRVLRRPDFDAIALRLDQSAGDARDHLRNALDFAARDDVHAFFDAATSDEAVATWSARSLPHSPNRRFGCRASIAAAALVCVVAGAATVEALRADLLWRRFIDPLGNHMRPTSTWFELQTPVHTVLQTGDALALRAALRGRALAHPQPSVFVRQTDGSTQIHALAADADGIWTFSMADVRRDFSWTVRLGGARSEMGTVQVRERPTITGVDVAYEYPSYARMKSRTETLTGRTITALEGTKTKITLRGNVPLASVTGTMQDESFRFQPSPREPNTAVRHHVVGASGRMELALRSIDGLESLREPPLVFRSVPDAPPSINVTSRFDDRAFFEDDSIAIAFRAQDDIGLSEISITAPGDIDIPVEVTPFGAKESEQTVNIPVSSLVSGKAASVSVRLLARDTKGQAASSQVITVRIAVNSFDRQLRTVLRGFEGTPSWNDAEQAGLKLGDICDSRLALLKGLDGHLEILREALAGGKGMADPAVAPLLKNVEQPLGQLENGFSAVASGLWHEVFGDAELLPRLRELGVYAMAGACLAANEPRLSALATAARGAADPKAAFAALQTEVRAAIIRQESANARVHAIHAGLRRELAGYLAATLEGGIARAAATGGTMDGDFSAVAQAQRAELGRLCAGMTTEIPEDVAAALRPTAGTPDMAALVALQPMLQKLVQALAPKALAFAMEDRSIASFLEAWPDTPKSGPARALVLTLQAASVSSDPLSDLLGRLEACRSGTGAAQAERAWATAHAPVLREYAAWQAVRADAEALRMGMISENLSPVRPEFQERWMALREAYAALCALRGAGAPELNGMAPLAAWQPPATTISAAVDVLHGWERVADAASTRQEGAVHGIFAAVAAHLAANRPLLRDSVRSGRAAIAEEIRVLAAEKTLSGNNRMLHFRFAELEALFLRTCDLAERAHLHKVAAPGRTDDLVAAAALAARTIEIYRQKVIVAYIPGNFKDAIQDDIWKGRSDVLRELDGFLAVTESLFGPSVTPETVRDIANKSSLLHIVTAELALQDRAAGAEGALAKPGDLLSAMAADRTRASAVWAQPCWRLYCLQRVLAEHPEKASAASGDLAKTLASFTALPKEIDGLSGLPERCRGAGAEDAREDVATFLKELRSLARETASASRSAPARAAERALASAAQGGGVSALAALRWNLSMAESARRLGGLSKRRTGSGGVGLVGDDLSGLKLPKHLYLELQRARGGAMPELFRESSGEYLNTILEKAR